MKRKDSPLTEEEKAQVERANELLISVMVRDVLRDSLATDLFNRYDKEKKQKAASQLQAGDVVRFRHGDTHCDECEAMIPTGTVGVVRVAPTATDYDYQVDFGIPHWDEADELVAESPTIWFCEEGELERVEEGEGNGRG